MPTAKKIVSAQIDIAASLQLDEKLNSIIPRGLSSDQMLAFFSERYDQGQSGSMNIEIIEDKAKFKWVLSRVEIEAEQFHKIALERARSKKYKSAIEAWIKAIALNPDDPDYYFNAGIAFFEGKNFKEAIENLEYALKLCPIYFKARLILGTIYLKLRKFDLAQAHLTESLFFNPANSLAMLNLGAAYSILKEYDKGVAAFLYIIDKSPSEARAHFGLGKIYSLQGNVTEANRCFKKVIELDTTSNLANHAKRALVTEYTSTSTVMAMAMEASGSQDVDAIDAGELHDLYVEGYTAYLFGDYEKSTRLYGTYLKVKAKDDYVWSSLGEAYLRLGKPKEASSAFKAAIKINANKALYYKQLAIAFDFLSQSKDVLQTIEVAASLGKKDSTLFTIWGKNLIKCERYDDAVKKLSKALKMNKSNISAEYHLALAYIKCNKKDEAVEHLHRVLQAKVKSPIKADAENLVNSIKG